METIDKRRLVAYLEKMVASLEVLVTTAGTPREGAEANGGLLVAREILSTVREAT